MEDNYNKVAELAVRSAKMIKDRSQIGTHWCALSLLYVEMARRKEITTLRDIGKDKALLYWTEACVLRPEASRSRRIWITQALYMYDLMVVGIS